jgi:hypothetical protein
MFMELYRLYDKYHYEKDWLTWIAATAYLGFVGVAAQWLVTNAKYWAQPQYRYLLGIVLAVICGLMACFVYLQNKYKVVAVAITYKLNRLFPRFDRGVGPTWGEMQNAISDPCTQIWRDGKAGCVLILLIFSLGIAQVLLVLFYT